ncbi:MAG: hypothetical protein ACO2PL_15060 [Armatimonadota bacterium]
MRESGLRNLRVSRSDFAPYGRKSPKRCLRETLQILNGTEGTPIVAPEVCARQQALCAALKGRTGGDLSVEGTRERQRSAPRTPTTGRQLRRGGCQQASQWLEADWDASSTVRPHFILCPPLRYWRCIWKVLNTCGKVSRGS